MLYSPERSSPARAASAVLTRTSRTHTRAHAVPGQRQHIKEADKLRMGRGKKAILLRLASYVSSALPLLAASALLTLPAPAQSARSWDKRGADAEARHDYDAAYEDYKQAIEKKPKDVRYKAHFERMRFQAAVSHVDRGRVLRQNGDLPGALTEFNRALQIDSGNEAARQELDQTQKELNAPPPPQPATPNGAAAQNTAQQQAADLATLAGPIELKPVSDAPLTLRMVEDV